MEQMEDILKDFLLEAGENLHRLDQDLVRLEQVPADMKIIGNVFRALHTIKGSSGFFAFQRLVAVAHAVESLLGKIRAGQLTLNAAMVTALLTTLDRVREIVRAVAATGKEAAGDDTELIGTLHAPAESKPVPAPAAAPGPSAPVARATTPTPASASMDSFPRDFLAESHENLDPLDRAFVTLEQTPADRALFATVLPHVAHAQGQQRLLRLRAARTGGARRGAAAGQTAHR